jgi:beta-mannosidase
VPEDPDTYATASQISQAEADKYFIERIRVGRPHKSGIIWWNLLDGWPQMSDAVVDYYFVKKLAYRYIKNSQAPFTVAADEMQNWGLPIYLCNDTRDIKRGHLKIWDADTEEILFERDFEAGANRSTPITKLPLFYSEKRLLIFDWTLDNGEVGRNHYLTGFPPFSLEKYLSWIEKGIL